MSDWLKARRGLCLPPLLTLALAAALTWYYDVFIDWRPKLYPLAIIAVALGVIALTLLALHARGAKKTALIWKAALSVFVFLAALLGVSFIINNALNNGNAAKLAISVALPLAAAQILVLLVLALQARLKKGGFAYKALTLINWLAGALALALSVLSYAPMIDGGIKAADGRCAYTFAYSAEKVTRTKKILGKRETLRVTMGKNEREGLQFILRQRNDQQGIFTLSLSDLANENGDAIPVVVYQEGYTFAGTGKGEGLYPDALVPYGGEIVSAPKGINQGFYIELRTGRDTPAGVYTATVTVRDAEPEHADNAATFSALFTVEVVDVTYPGAAYNDSAVGLGSGQFYALNGVEQGTPEAEALYKRYYDDLLDHKLSVYGLPYDILDPRADAYMSDPRVKTFLIPYPDDDAQLQSYYEKVQSDPEWARKGYFYPIDEPHTAEAIARYNAITERLGRLCPGYHMVTPFYTWQFDEGGADYDNLATQNGRSDIICPESNVYDKAGFPEAVRKRVEDNGDRAWWYVCCGPTGDYCNMFIPLQGTRHRLLFWQQYQQNVTGLLYWSVTYWQKANPWMSAASWGSYETAGDGTWFYPGPAVGRSEPIPSLRLKNIADGMEDYDLLCMAEEAFGRDYCLEKAAQLSTTLTKYTSDPAKIEQVRVSMLKDLAKQ